MTEQNKSAFNLIKESVRAVIKREMVTEQKSDEKEFESQFILSQSILDINAQSKLADDTEFITNPQILSLLNTNSPNYIIIDVRDTAVDYLGGHITKSINISNEKFYHAIPQIVAQYHSKCTFIIQCMYGAHRSIECMEFYAKAKSEIIANYSKQKASSFYINYVSKPKPKQSDDEQSDDDNIGNGKTKFGAMDDMNDSQYINKTKIGIKCNEEMYANLCKQKLYIGQDGFFGFINDANVDNENKNILTNFDIKQWEELSIKQQKKLYHHTEFFADSGLFQSRPIKSTHIDQTIDS